MRLPFSKRFHAVRCRKGNGQWAMGVLLSALSAQQVLALTGQPRSCLSDPVAVLGDSVSFYEQRGGGVETSLVAKTRKR